jgi:CDP-diacylglycerol---serine O-phosphatidyltransferase
MKIKNQIPNLLTLGNLFCGCLAVYFIYQGKLSTAAIFILVAAVLDFADGFVARLLKVSGEMGKQLDSLADMVSFGLVPGTLVFWYLQKAIDAQNLTIGYWEFFKFFPYIITLFSAYRLAKFNIDTRQTEDFIGLNTPANTLFWIAFPLFFEFQFPNLTTESTLLSYLGFVYNFTLGSPFTLCTLSLFCSILLVSELKIFSLKFKKFTWAGNEIRFIFLAISLLLILLLFFAAIPIIIILYVLLSILQNQISKKNAI